MRHALCRFSTVNASIPSLSFSLAHLHPKSEQPNNMPFPFLPIFKSRERMMRNWMEILSSDDNPNPTWLFDCDLMILDDNDHFPAAVSAANFSASPPLDFTWASQPINYCSSEISWEVDNSFAGSESLKKPSSRKRLKSGSCASGSKACREKLRREQLQERFLELSSLLEDRRPPKIDKSAILNDAARAVAHLRSETERLKESNEDLQEKINELKRENGELRDEKQKLKYDKEQMEQRIKAFPAHPGSNLSSMGVSFAAQRQAPGNNLMPFISYPGLAMWQFMQPAVVDTSQDHVLRPPVA